MRISDWSSDVCSSDLITGCEGYVESSAVGLLAGRFAAAELAGRSIATPPPSTGLGALLGHITGDAEADNYQPMNVNFGLCPPMDAKVHKQQRKEAMTARGRMDLEQWRSEENTSALPSLK